MGVWREGQAAARQQQADQARPLLSWTADLQTQPEEVWELLTLAQQQQLLRIITNTCCSLVSPAISSSIREGE
jgi:hypothetical protein